MDELDTSLESVAFDMSLLDFMKLKRLAVGVYVYILCFLARDKATLTWCGLGVPVIPWAKEVPAIADEHEDHPFLGKEPASWKGFQVEG